MRDLAAGRPCCGHAARHVERQFRARPAAPIAGMAGRSPARCRLPAGDQDLRGRVPECGDRRAWVCRSRAREWPLERGRHFVPGRDRRGVPRVPRRTRLPRNAGQGYRGNLQRRAGVVGVRAQRPVARQPHHAYKLEWLAALRKPCRADAPGRPRPCCGDFNIAPTDDDVWDPAAFAGATHVSPAERQALAICCGSGSPTYARGRLKAEPFTYWDYRAGVSTAASACASTWSSPARRWPRRCGTLTWTARPGRERRPPTTHRSSSIWTWPPDRRKGRRRKSVPVTKMSWRGSAGRRRHQELRSATMTS